MGVSTLFYASLGSTYATVTARPCMLTSVTVANIGVQDGVLRVLRKGTTEVILSLRVHTTGTKVWTGRIACGQGVDVSAPAGFGLVGVTVGYE